MAVVCGGAGRLRIAPRVVFGSVFESGFNIAYGPKTADDIGAGECLLEIEPKYMFANGLPCNRTIAIAIVI